MPSNKFARLFALIPFAGVCLASAPWLDTSRVVGRCLGNYALSLRPQINEPYRPVVTHLPWGCTRRSFYNTPTSQLPVGHSSSRSYLPPSDPASYQPILTSSIHLSLARDPLTPYRRPLRHMQPSELTHDHHRPLLSQIPMPHFRKENSTLGSPILEPQRSTRPHRPTPCYQTGLGAPHSELGPPLIRDRFVDAEPSVSSGIEHQDVNGPSITVPIAPTNLSQCKRRLLNNPPASQLTLPDTSAATVAASQVIKEQSNSQLLPSNKWQDKPITTSIRGMTYYKDSMCLIIFVDYCPILIFNSAIVPDIQTFRQLFEAIKDLIATNKVVRANPIISSDYPALRITATTSNSDFDLLNKEWTFKTLERVIERMNQVVQDEIRRDEAIAIQHDVLEGALGEKIEEYLAIKEPEWKGTTDTYRHVTIQCSMGGLPSNYIIPRDVWCAVGECWLKIEGGDASLVSLKIKPAQDSAAGLSSMPVMVDRLEDSFELVELIMRHDEGHAKQIRGGKIEVTGTIVIPDHQPKTVQDYRNYLNGLPINDPYNLVTRTSFTLTIALLPGMKTSDPFKALDGVRRYIKSSLEKTPLSIIRKGLAKQRSGGSL